MSNNIIDKIQLSGITYDIGGGGGKAIEAGRGIAITTGETADTVSFNLPISAGTGTDSVKENYVNNVASGSYSHAEGNGTSAKGIMPMLKDIKHQLVALLLMLKVS